MPLPCVFYISLAPKVAFGPRRSSRPLLPPPLWPLACCSIQLFMNTLERLGPDYCTIHEKLSPLYSLFMRGELSPYSTSIHSIQAPS